MKINKTSFGILTLLFFLSSCSNLIEKNVSTESCIETTLKVNLSDYTRTVFPKTNIEELTNFELHGNNQILGRYSSLSSLQKAKIKLDTGVWNFTLTAKKGDSMYKAEKSQTIVQGENTLSFDLKLYTYGQGKGAFSISLDFSEAKNSDKVSSAKAVLQNIDGSTIKGIEEKVLTVTDGKITYSENNVSVINSVANGSYRVLITLYSDTLELFTWREIVVISSDLVSSAERKIDSLDNIYHVNYILNDNEERKAVFSSNVQELYTRKTPSFSIPAINRPSYKFLGWYENEDFTGNPVSVIDTSKLEDITLYAKWQSLFGDSSLQNLLFTGQDVKIYDNENTRNEINADVNTHEYYIEYKTLKVIAELTNPWGSMSLSNNNTEMEIEAYDSTAQDITLTVTSEDNNSSISYLLHAVKIFNYEEACSIIANRKKGLFIKIIDENENINTVGSSISSPPTPSVIGTAINKKNYDVSIDLSATSITKIGNYAFSQCCALKEIVMPNSIKSIGESAFLNCSGLREILLPNSLENIQAEAFGACTSLKSFVIPNKVSSIKDRTFANCSKLEKLDIPNSVKSIGNQAFYNCTNLKDLKFEDKESIWFGSPVVNFGVKHEIGKMNSEDNIKKMFGYYNYYKIF